MTPTATDRNSIVKWGAYILRRDDCLIRHGANSIRCYLRDKRRIEHLNWNEAADLIIKSMEKTIASKVVTYDFARLMDGATEVKCSEFGEELIKNMD